MIKKTPFPSKVVNEWTVIRRYTAPGLFAYRHLQAGELLYLPDFGDGDMTRDQRREALDRYVENARPLTALDIFLNVVALEDFIRDLGIRIAKLKDMAIFFPNIGSLNLVPQKTNPNRPFKQVMKDPVSLTDFDKLNDLYLKAIGVAPINRADITRLYDLAIIRHCVAHNGSIIRQSDAPRFQYYSVVSNTIITPPVDFVKETSTFLYSVGRHFEETIRSRVFSRVIDSLDVGWERKRPRILREMIEVFDYFGKLPPASGKVPMSDKEKAETSAKNQEYLITECICELEKIYK